ncbi:amino acid permease [Actinomadura sp. NBRC 104412]|uniref:APC family permease n=1 Tax=Actinomadura sp. NBRC 104412 TaxID=3032203 RepID=UPI0024A3E49F|nr:APC family permease [Actinomadura sp. NBRC 104412]GLZ05646.1 amino acid permease [Actinomadura sp. NBRC 104412]
MSALATAIAEALSRSDTPVSGPRGGRGLDRRRLGVLPVAAQAVATVAPSPGMVSATGLATSLGAVAVPVLGLAALLMVLVSLAIAQFARRITAAGSLYTYAAKGLGPAGGFLTGCLLLLAYGALVVMCLFGAGRRTAGFLTEAGVPLPAGGDGPTLLAAALLGTVMTACVIRGVRISASLTLLLEACSVITVLAVLLLSAATGAPGLPAASHASGTAASALIVSVTALVGFESGCGLGVETRRPFAVVPRVVIWTPAGCGLLFVLAGALHLAGPGGAGPPGEGPAPFLPGLLHLGLASSLFACAMASGNAVTRVLFTMGREGMLPAVLSRTHPRRRTPHAAAYAMTPFAIALPGALWAMGLPPGPLSGALSALTVLAFLAAYLLVCAAAPLFLHRIGEHVPATTGTAVLAACASAAVLAGVVVTMAGEGRVRLLGLFGLTLVLGMAWFLRVRRRAPHRAAAIGYFDPAAPEDVLPGALPEGPSWGERSRHGRH